jgi:hypothetical protein
LCPPDTFGPDDFLTPDQLAELLVQEFMAANPGDWRHRASLDINRLAIDLNGTSQLANAGPQGIAGGFPRGPAIGDAEPRHIGPTSSPVYTPLVPPQAARYWVPAGGNTDNIGTSLINFLVGAGPEIDFIYGPDTTVSRRFWEHSDFLAPSRDWFNKGAKMFCKCNNSKPDQSTYWTGLQRVQFTAPPIDFIRDLLVQLGWNLVNEGFPYSDWPIQQFGSFTMDYQGSIDCASNSVGFHAVIFNAWSIASATRNPLTRQPLLSGGRRVYEEVIIDKTGPACG